MKKLFLAILFLSFASAASAASSLGPWKGWDPAFYLGVGYSFSSVDTGISSLTGTASLDEDDSGFKIIGGFKFNRFMGIELSYNDLGKASLSGNTGDTFVSKGISYAFTANGVKIEAEATTIALEGIYFIPLDYFTGLESLKYFEPFLKIGLHFWDIEYSMSATNFNRVKADDDGTDAVFGAGINFKPFEKLTVRAEWERFKTDEDIDSFSGSLIFNF